MRLLTSQNRPFDLLSRSPSILGTIVCRMEEAMVQSCSSLPIHHYWPLDEQNQTANEPLSTRKDPIVMTAESLTKTQTSMKAWRKAKLSIKSRSVNSPSYSTSFLEPSTIVTVEKHNWWLDKVCLQTVRCCRVLGTCRWPSQLGPWLAGSEC